MIFEFPVTLCLDKTNTKESSNNTMSTDILGSLIRSSLNKAPLSCVARSGFTKRVEARIKVGEEPGVQEYKQLQT